MKFIFHFGNSPELSFAELSCVLSQFKLQPLTEIQRLEAMKSSTVVVEISSDEMTAIAGWLGGTVKISVLDLVHKNLENIENSLKTLIINLSSGKKRVNFGFSFIGNKSPGNFNNQLLLTKKVKDLLSESGYNSRFVLPPEGKNHLSSVVVHSQNITDISIFQINNEVLVSHTVWVQDYEAWGLRDYGRPQSQAHIGMLPLKVARMMINIGLPFADDRRQPITIFDPFCGVGTILSESLFMGFDVIGSDINPQQLRRTRQNLEWSIDKFKLQNSFALHHIDAGHVSSVIKNHLDAIVTEPYLGPNDLSLSSISKAEFSKLNGDLLNQYQTCLKDWKKILKKDGKVVIVVPSFTSVNISQSDKTYLVKMVIDKAKIMGYSLFCGPFQYARPQAIIKRNVLVFQI